MENFDALRTDSSGRPQYRLSARKLKHYSGSKRTELDSPRFVLLDAKAGDVKAAARQATVSSSSNEVILQGNVNVIRAARLGQAAMTINSEKLIVLPESNQLRSPGPVEIRDANLNLRAGSMEYNASQRIIKLKGRVQARYISRKS